MNYEKIISCPIHLDKNEKKKFLYYKNICDLPLCYIFLNIFSSLLYNLLKAFLKIFKNTGKSTITDIRRYCNELERKRSFASISSYGEKYAKTKIFHTFRINIVINMEYSRQRTSGKGSKNTWEDEKSHTFSILIIFFKYKLFFSV